MAHSELDLRDRRKIEDMLRAKVPVDEIAVALGRHRSTIYREIVGNRFVDAELPYLTGYWGVVAEEGRGAACAAARPPLPVCSS